MKSSYKVRLLSAGDDRDLCSSKSHTSQPTAPTGKDRVLGVDVGEDIDFEVLLEDFEDFVPNENGAVVTAVRYRS